MKISQTICVSIQIMNDCKQKKYRAAEAQCGYSMLSMLYMSQEIIVYTSITGTWKQYYAVLSMLQTLESNIFLFTFFPALASSDEVYHGLCNSG